VSAPVAWLPEVALAPDHAPEAEHEVVFVEDQVSVEDPPLATAVGFAASDTVIPAGGSESELSSVPPQAASTRASTKTSSKVLVRNLGILIPSPAQQRFFDGLENLSLWTR
jgi:hypothetical protein